MSGANLKSEPRTIVLSNAALQLIAVAQARRWSDKRGFHLISDVLPFGRLWYDTADNAICYAIHSSRSHDAVIRVYEIWLPFFSLVSLPKQLVTSYSQRNFTI